MSKNSNLLLALLTGAAVGACVGVLFAPDKGENTRGKLSFQLDKYSKKLDMLVKELIDGKDLRGNEARSEGEKIVSDTKEKAKKLLDDVNGLIHKIQDGEEI